MPDNIVIRDRPKLRAAIDEYNALRRRVSFTVPGQPKPLARARARSMGKFAQVYDPKENKVNRAYVRQVANEAMRGLELFTGPLIVGVEAWFTWPKSKQFKCPDRIRPDLLAERVSPVIKPDLDNVVKLVWDACNEVVWHDDSQICRSYSAKHYCITSVKPRIVVSVRELNLIFEE